jgi:hypothetical protein
MSNQETSFNVAQLATWEQARDLAARLSQGPLVVGNGVAAESQNPDTSGIYIPAWLTQTGFQAPHYVDADGNQFLYLHFRFNNGAEGMNVGLVREQFKRYPTSPMYVTKCLADEAASLARR